MKKIEDNTIPVYQVKEVEPVGVPARCPVCNGHGTLSYGQITCHACKGKGYLLIPTKEVKKGKKNDPRYQDPHFE